MPQEAGDASIVSGAMVRCKNLRTNETGKAITRDGSAKINGSAIDTDIWLIEEQSGVRYTFAGSKIYANESSIETGLTSAAWAAIKYNAFNDVAQNVFALNGTDRKRIQGSFVYEWGIEAPTFSPTLSQGVGAGLTGLYNVKYTYVRKVGDVVVAESNPSPAATVPVSLTNQSLSVEISDSLDDQVTHARIYRTFANGDVYHLDSEIDISGYDYGYTYGWEIAHLSGTGFKFTMASTASASSGSDYVRITSQNVYAYDGFFALATYTLDSSGIASTSSATISNEWLVSGSVSDYEARATLLSGSVSTGTTGSWLSLSTSPSWGKVNNVTSTIVECQLFIEIRLASTGEVVASATVLLSAEIA